MPQKICRIGQLSVKMSAPVENMSQIIGASVLPVALISASGLLCLAFYNRLLAITMRLRSFQRERFQEQEFLMNHADKRETDVRILQRHQGFLRALQVQCGQLIERARALRRCLLSLLACVALLVPSSLAMGLSVLWPLAAYAAVPLFASGVVLLFIGVCFAIYELQLSVAPIELEQEFIERLEKDFEDANGSHSTGV